MTVHHAARRRSSTEQRRFEDALRELFERRIPFNEVLGFRIESFDPRAPQVVIPMRPDLVGHFLFGRLHGGVISAVLDATGGFAIMVAIGEKFCDEDADQVMARFGKIGTVDLRIDYLHPGIGREFRATANVTRLGGRIASVQMALRGDDDALIATGAASYVVS